MRSRLQIGPRAFYASRVSEVSFICERNAVWITNEQRPLVCPVPAYFYSTASMLDKIPGRVSRFPSFNRNRSNTRLHVSDDVIETSKTSLENCFTYRVLYSGKHCIFHLRHQFQCRKFYIFLWVMRVSCNPAASNSIFYNREFLILPNENEDEGGHWKSNARRLWHRKRAILFKLQEDASRKEQIISRWKLFSFSPEISSLLSST